MPKQHACIAEYTVGAGGVATVDFTSIPQTYTDLYLSVSVRGANSGGPESYFLYASFNGVTTNRTYRRLEATGGSISYDTGSLAPICVAGGTAVGTNIFAAGSTHISNYSSTTANKNYYSSWSSEHDSTASDVGIIAGLWQNSAAISSISIYLSSGNIAQHSRFSLYGITKS